MTGKYSISSGSLIQIIRYLDSIGIDSNAFMDGVSLRHEMLSNPDTRIPIEKYIEVEKMAALVSEDPFFGLHMGQFAEAGGWSIVGYMMMNCRTVLEGFAKFAKYSDIVGNLISGKMHVEDGKASVRLVVPADAPEIPRNCFEGYFSSLICLARNLSGKNIRPMEVGFAFPSPENTEAYTQIFDAAVLFEQKDNYMLFDLAVVETQVLQPNENLLAYFEEYAREFLASLENNSITYRTNRLILENLERKDLGVGFIARKSAMSVRALQIHLKQENAVFADLLKNTRERVAKKSLRDNDTVENIAFILGFSDVSSFRRAFRKWTGMTPGEYRKKVCTLP